MLGFIIKLLKKGKSARVPTPLPPFEDIVEIMHNKSLDSYTGTVIDVIYSTDKTMRYVIASTEKGLFCYSLEMIYPFDEDEWIYISQNENALPAMWAPHPDAINASLFETKEGALREIYAEPHYKNYFI